PTSGSPGARGLAEAKVPVDFDSTSGTRPTPRRPPRSGSLSQPETLSPGMLSGVVSLHVMSYGRWFLVRVVGTESDEQVRTACSLLERVVVDGHGLRDELRVACLPYGATFATTAWTTDYVILRGSNTAWAEEVRASVAAAAGPALPGLAVEFDWMGDLDDIRALAALDDRDDRPIEVAPLYP